MKNLSNTIEILRTSIHQYAGNENKFDTRPTQSIKPDQKIENLIKDLPNKSIDELRKLWKSYCDEEAPNWNNTLSRDYLTAFRKCITQLTSDQSCKKFLKMLRAARLKFQPNHI